MVKISIVCQVRHTYFLSVGVAIYLDWWPSSSSRLVYYALLFLMCTLLLDNGWDVTLIFANLARRRLTSDVSLRRAKLAKIRVHHLIGTGTGEA